MSMTNVDKYRCRECGKYTYIPHSNEQKIANRRVAERRRRVRQYETRNPPIVSPPNSYVIFNHQKKGNAFIRALAKQGKYKQLFEAEEHAGLSFVLTDSDIMGRTFRLDKFRRWGCKNFFVIPHTARPNLVNDIMPGWRHTTAQFVVSKGHIEIMRLYGYDKPLHAVGWNLCPLRKFKPRREPRNILFAPIHPRCSQVDRDVNAETFKRLYRLAKSDDIDLTVRFIRSLSDSGLEQVNHPRVHYVSGHMIQEYDHIDQADVVIGHQTIAWLAVARGVPTLMMAEERLPTHIEPRGRSPRFAQHWKDYVHLLAYPLDILACDDTLGLLRRAVCSDVEIEEWRKRLIGTQFRSERFINALEKYL